MLKKTQIDIALIGVVERHLKKVKMVEKVVYVILENGIMEIQVQKW